MILDFGAEQIDQNQGVRCQLGLILFSNHHLLCPQITEMENTIELLEIALSDKIKRRKRYL